MNKAKRKCNIPRTLGNYGSYVNRYWQHKKYLNHRKWIANAKPLIDNAAPKLYPHIYIKFNVMHNILTRAVKIEKDNKYLLYRINHIHRTKGSLDTFWKKYPTIKSPFAALRKNEAKKITKINGIIYKKLKSVCPVYNYEAQKEEWKKTVKLMTQISAYNKLTISAFPVPKVPEIGMPQNKLMTRPYRCFFDVEVEGGIKLGRIIFEIYSDIVPKTAFNFLAICKGNLGLTYKGSVFHRITPGLMCQGGDITKGNGSGGMSVYGLHFPDENFILQHGGAGIVSMANSGVATNNSIFNITFRPLLSLNGVCVVIGRVVDNMKVLNMIEEFGTASGKPRKKVFIANCGLICY